MTCGSTELLVPYLHVPLLQYNDTTEVVVELTDIFLELVYIGNLKVKGEESSQMTTPHYTVKRIKSAS